MRKSDFQLIGYVGTVVGVLLLIGAAITFSSSQYYLTPSGHYDGKLGRAYLDYSVILSVVGIVSLVIGLGFLWRAGQQTTQQKAPTEVPKPPEAF